jgi:Helix-turn-helix domain
MSMEMVAHVRDFSKSTGNAKFLLLIIASHYHPLTGRTYPSLDTLAREATLSKPSIIKLIRELERLDELEVTRGRGRGHSNHYRILLHHEAPPDPSRKGKRSIDHLAPEKVNEPAEKVNDGAEKGQYRVYSKERLERHILERGWTPATKTCARDGCDQPQCPHWQQCREHACCEFCAVADAQDHS